MVFLKNHFSLNFLQKVDFGDAFFVNLLTFCVETILQRVKTTACSAYSLLQQYLFLEHSLYLRFQGKPLARFLK